jgi:hypothetical protein
VRGRMTDRRREPEKKRTQEAWTYSTLQPVSSSRLISVSNQVGTGSSRMHTPKQLTEPAAEGWRVQFVRLRRTNRCSNSRPAS